MSEHSWKPSDAINSPVAEMTDIDPTLVPRQDFYKLMISTIVPRPIAFVSTVGKDGSGNLAPFSFFNGVCSNPPCVMVSIVGKEDGGPKDTLRNIQETNQFVVNSANEWLIEPLVYCGAAYPYGVDELKKVGLTAIPSVKVKPPRVAEAAVQFECELYQTIPIGEGAGSTTLVLGKIVLAHVANSVYTDGKVDATKLKPVGRLGTIEYGKISDIFSLAIPKPS